MVFSCITDSLGFSLLFQIWIHFFFFIMLFPLISNHVPYDALRDSYSYYSTVKSSIVLWTPGRPKHESKWMIMLVCEHSWECTRVCQRLALWVQPEAEWNDSPTLLTEISADTVRMRFGTFNQHKQTLLGFFLYLLQDVIKMVRACWPLHYNQLSFKNIQRLWEVACQRIMFSDLKEVFRSNDGVTDVQATDVVGTFCTAIFLLPHEEHGLQKLFEMWTYQPTIVDLFALCSSLRWVLH